jgi:hypothetical protein
MPVSLATQRQRSGELWFEASPGKYFTRPYLKNIHHKKGLVEWLRAEALSLSPSTTKNTITDKRKG